MTGSLYRRTRQPPTRDRGSCKQDLKALLCTVRIGPQERRPYSLVPGMVQPRLKIDRRQCQ